MRANEKEKKKKRTSSYETKTYFYQKKVGLTTGKFSIWETVATHKVVTKFIDNGMTNFFSF